MEARSPSWIGTTPRRDLPRKILMSTSLRWLSRAAQEKPAAGLADQTQALPAGPEASEDPLAFTRRSSLNSTALAPVDMVLQLLRCRPVFVGCV
eukprot:745650-Hanusia_phi.AAC.3